MPGLCPRISRGNIVTESTKTLIRDPNSLTIKIPSYLMRIIRDAAKRSGRDPETVVGDLMRQEYFELEILSYQGR
jgi:hypothetical protein